MRAVRSGRRRGPFIAAAALAAAGLVSPSSAAVGSVADVAAAVSQPRNVPLLQSPQLNRPMPRAGKAKGYSAGLTPRQPPRAVAEIVKDRTATSSTWRDVNGSITVRRYLEPHFYKPSPSAGWAPIDTALTAVAGRPGWWRSGANSWLVSFAPTGTRRGAEQISLAGADVGFAPLGGARRAVTASVSGSVATYGDLWSDTDMVEQVTSTGVAENLVLSGPSAPSRFVFGLSGATARLSRSGGLDIIAGGRLVGTVPPLTVQTSRSLTAMPARRAVPARSRSLTAGADATLSAAGGRVIESVSARWLASLPKTAFPVVIDPVFSVAGTYANAIETCYNGGSCVAGDPGDAFIGTSPTAEVVAAYVPYPAPPNPGAGQQPWVPTDSELEAGDDENGPGSPCPTSQTTYSCEFTDQAAWGFASKPSSYSGVVGAPASDQLPMTPDSVLFSFDLNPWLSVTAHQPGSWFALGGEGLKVDNNSPFTKTAATVPIAANDIYVSVAYNQEPAAPVITAPQAAWPADNVVTTAEPTLTATRTDPDFCTSTGQQPSNGEYCDQPENVTYDFQVSTSPVWGEGQIVADSGWIPQPFTTPGGCQSNCQITLQTPSWTVPAGALADAMTYYVTVQSANSNQNFQAALDTDIPVVPAALPGAPVKMTVKLDLGAGGTSPTDTVGTPPGQTSLPAQGAPSPGLSTASETVNMVTGNLSVAVGTPSMSTLGGPAGMSLTYNSSQSSTVTGTYYGLNASFYPDSGSHVFPSSPVGSGVEPDIELSDAPAPPVGGISPGSAWMAKWTGTITLPSTVGGQAASWELGGLYDGGMQVSVGGNTIYNDWSGTHSGGTSPTFASTTFAGSSAYQITVENWEPAHDGLLELWADDIAASPAQPYVVPSSWLNLAPTGLPPGWSNGAATSAWTSATDMGTQVVLHSATGATASFTNNGNGTYTAQPGDTDWLTDVKGQIQLSAANGYQYVFNTNGQLQSMTTAADDLHPTALRYTYGPALSEAGAPVVLQSITDPVSGRSVTLNYGTASACPDQNNALLLCGISYWDGSFTSFVYNGNDQLAEVINPSVAPELNADLFGYDADGRLNDIRDALAMSLLAANLANEPACDPTADGTCVLDTLISYSTAGQVLTVRQPEPQNGAARPVRTYAYYPSASTPGAGSTTVSIAGFSPAGTGCTQPAPGCSPAGVASSVSYDNQSRIISATTSTGLTSYTTWDTENRPIITLNQAGDQTSTVYDSNSDITDTYGPAPAACFSSATLPAGVTVSGPVAGYLPVSNPQGTSGCNVAVPHAHNGYDDNITGLAETYWPDGQYAGAPALHSTGNGSSTSTSSPSTCNSDGTTQFGTNSSTDLCVSWPAGTTPSNIGTDANDQWSMEISGTISLPYTGDYLWCVADTQNFTMSIGNNVALTNMEYQSATGKDNFAFQGSYVKTLPVACQDFDARAGADQIAISLVGSSAQVTSYDVGYQEPDPDGGTTGPTVGVPLSWLDPTYGLETSTTDPDGDVTTYSYSNPTEDIDPDYGLVTSTTHNPGGGLAPLTTTTSYENPAQGGYLRKLSSILPAGNTTSYAYYTGTGGPVAAACGVSSATAQGGQVQQQTDPSPGGSGQSRVEQFVYDAAGRQAGERLGTPADIATQLWQCTTYDAMGRITQQSWPATSTAPARTVSYNYDVGGNPLVSSVSDSSGTITSTVDLLGRLVAYTDGLGQTTTYAYDQAGQNTTTTFDPATQDATTQLGYDPNSGNPTTTAVNGTVLATASYSTTGRLASVAYANGTTATLGYDAYGNQDSLAYSTTSSGTTFDADAATYTLADRYSTETASQGTGTLDSTYGYDGAGRLTSADDTISGTTTDSTYSYAASPSCTASGDDTNAGDNTNISAVGITTGTSTSSTSYCYNNADQLVSSVTGSTTSTAYAYSEDGDQTDDDGTSYAWDASDRVVTASTSGGTTVTSTYDAVSRLIESSQSGGSTVRYAYAGWTATPAAVLNTSGQVLQQLIGLPGGVAVALQSAGNTWSYTNLRGDTTATTSNTGAVTARPVTYNPWGVLNPGQTAPASTTGPDTLGAYATSGKLTATATGTILLGARTLNPAEARFLSVDPVNGGCANPYTYAFGDPLEYGDLSGMDECSDATWSINIKVSQSGISADIDIDDMPDNIVAVTWAAMAEVNGKVTTGSGVSIPYGCILNPFCNDKTWSTDLDVFEFSSSEHPLKPGIYGAGQLGVVTAYLAVTLADGTTCEADEPLTVPITAAEVEAVF
jgi:RHS repeat-associated protein